MSTDTDFEFGFNASIAGLERELRSKSGRSSGTAGGGDRPMLPYRDWVSGEQTPVRGDDGRALRDDNNNIIYGPNNEVFYFFANPPMNPSTALDPTATFLGIDQVTVNGQWNRWKGTETPMPAWLRNVPIRSAKPKMSGSKVRFDYSDRDPMLDLIERMERPDDRRPGNTSARPMPSYLITYVRMNADFTEGKARILELGKRDYEAFLASINLLIENVPDFNLAGTPMHLMKTAAGLQVKVDKKAPRLDMSQFTPISLTQYVKDLRMAVQEWLEGEGLWSSTPAPSQQDTAPWEKPPSPQTTAVAEAIVATTEEAPRDLSEPASQATDSITDKVATLSALSTDELVDMAKAAGITVSARPQRSKLIKQLATAG